MFSLSVWRDKFVAAFSSSAGVVAPAVSAGRRLYVLGDVHGRADLLERRYQDIAEDLRDDDDCERSVLVHLGDYVDRGPQSREVLERLSQDAVPTDEALYLLGNHEDMMLRFMEQPELGRSWMELGGDACLASFGVGLTPQVPPSERMARIAADFKACFPAHHRQFLARCLDHYREGGYFFAHAGVRPGRSLDRQERGDLLWIRSQFLQSRRDHGAMVIHGHNITAEPDVQRNRIGIDTGACFSGRLSCLVLQGESRRFLP